MTLKQQQKKAEAAIAAWNDAYPVGQRVRVLKDGGATIETTTRSMASVMCCSAVIWLDGISGCYALDRVTAIS